MYDEMLNECNNTIRIGYIEFEPSRVLEELDPIAYNCGLSEYYDSIYDEYYCKDME
jgi:hypothetical protein